MSCDRSEMILREGACEPDHIEFLHLEIGHRLTICNREGTDGSEREAAAYFVISVIVLHSY